MPCANTTVEKSAPLPRREYTITWQWRHDDPKAAKNREVFSAVSVQAAMAKLRADLGEHYLFCPTDLVVIDCRSDD